MNPEDMKVSNYGDLEFSALKHIPIAWVIDPPWILRRLDEDLVAKIIQIKLEGHAEIMELESKITARLAKVYKGIAAEMALNEVEYDILGSFVQSTRSAQTSYRVNLESVLVGEIARDTIMNLSLEDGEWRVQT